jgi:4-oxalocrotonate tautomerase
MPSVHIKMFEGRSKQQKAELAEALTKETCRVLKCSPEAVDIVFEDVKKENWATAGVLWSDKSA